MESFPGYGSRDGTEKLGVLQHVSRVLGTFYLRGNLEFVVA